MEAALILAIIKAIIDHGPSAVNAISKALENSDPTPEDIAALFITKDPGDYFGIGGD